MSDDDSMLTIEKLIVDMDNLGFGRPDIATTRRLRVLAAADREWLPTG